MELDFASVKALSSPTRLRILSAVIDTPRTPTGLSRDLGKSKSTISTHLTKLERAGLVEKDQKAGRRRVTYAATGKAEAIVTGKERKVKFSVVSSTFTGILGIVLIGSRLRGQEVASMDAGQTTALRAENTAVEAAARDTTALLNNDAVILGLGVAALLVAAGSLLYAVLLSRLPARFETR